jgi:hypothetical protein
VLALGDAVHGLTLGDTRMQQALVSDPASLLQEMT